MDAVERAMKLNAEGKALPPKILRLHVPAGGFHVKALVMNMERSYFTIIRTGAATGEATKYLARQNTKIETICGWGNQGRISMEAIPTMRQVEMVYACDIDPAEKFIFAEDMAESLNVPVTPVDNLDLAARQSDICVTCTTSRKPFLNKEDVNPGTFISATGAASEDNQEPQSSLLASIKLIVELLEHSATIRELHHGFEAAVITGESMHPEFGEIIAGHKPERIHDNEIIIFDSTGTALQDVVASSIVYEKATTPGVGVKINLAS